jgi:hypothetical protein
LTSAVGIRLLFAGTMAFFAVQMLLIVENSEPYPALAMPAFSGRPLQGNVLVVEKPEFRVQFADRKVEVVRYESLLPDTPLDTLSIFKNAFPFYHFSIDDDTLAWLRSNIVRRFPERTPSGVDIVWRKAAYDLANPDQVTYTTVRTVHLDLGREP